MTKLLDYAGKEAMTYFDAGRLLVAAGEAIQGLPGAIVANANQSLADANTLIDKAKAAIRLCDNFMEELERGEEALCERYNKLYHTIQKKRGELSKKIEELPPMPEVRLPYNLDEIFKIAERLNDLTPEQMKRLIALAESFRPETRAT